LKRGSKVLLIVAIVVVGLIAAGIQFTIGWRPIFGPKVRPLTAQRFEPTPERLERGRYLATSLTGCLDCHSQRDWKEHGAPIVPGTEGEGADFPAKGLPGRIVAPNITPDPETGAGSWSDDQLARAIREGISHDGRTLFPIMPYAEFRNMADEDLASIIVFLRSLPPIKNPLPATEIAFPVKYLIRSVPEPVTKPVSRPDPANRVAWGKYVATIGACADCHTPAVHGKPVPGGEFSGGSVLEGVWGRVAAANLTPDASGISYYDEALFVQTIRTGAVKARPLSPIMPFGVYKNLTDDDLKALYAYLRTVKPVKHFVDNSEPPTFCKFCQQQHGGGDRN
jgi:mono/diheme cytochrome c family protein